MKSRSHRLPINEPPDDWGDGSWTVDCVCGVNFDDGEEMVNCDECGVWVHTRCSRFVKGETSFACDKCKSKKNGNDNEETEVAQLLVELPTKTITMENAYPPSAPPRSSSFRLWTEIPIEERVHVQGVPGGDPALFRGLSSVFTSELWKCSGYVPKKFNFQYREFPCWDEKDKQEPVVKVDEENENPVDRGADALFSLSKEIVSASPVEMLVGLRGSVEGGSREKKPAKKEGKKREMNDSSVRHVDNVEERETNHLQSFGTHLGKRKKDNLRSKDLSAKKKARSASREIDGKKRVSTTSIGVKELDSFKAGGSKVVETTFHDSMSRKKAKSTDSGPDGYVDVNINGSKGNLAVNVDYPEDSSKKVKLQDALVADAQNIDDLVKKAKPRDNLTTNTDDSFKKVKAKISLEPLPYHADESYKKGKSKDKLLAKSHHTGDFVKKVKLKDSYAANAYHGENISREPWKNSSLVEIVVKSENDHQVPTRTGNSSETVAVEVSLLEEPDGVSAVKKIKDLNTGVDGLDNHNDEKHDHGSGGLIRDSSTALSPPTLVPLVGDLRNVMTKVRESQVQDSVESTSFSSLRPDLKVNTGANDDQPKEKSVPLSSPNLEEKVESTRQLDREEKSSVSKHPFKDHQVHEALLSDEDTFTDSRILNSCEENNSIEGMIPISAEPCQNTEVIVSVGTLSVQESCSEPKHLKSEEPLKAVGINSAPPSPLSQRKVLGFGKSSSSVVISKSEVSGSCKPPGRPASPSTLRPIHFTKRVKANLSADIKKDHTVRDSHETTRTITKEALKGIPQNSISKQTSPDSKESVNYPSPKAPTAQNEIDSSGPIESSSALQPQIVSHVQNKATLSGFSEKGERFNQPASHLSSKVTHSSTMLPPPPVKSTLSDEELALLLHQELNSSPRVPRVPRVRHAGSTPQSAVPTATSMLTKRTSSSGVKDHISVSRRKSREEASKDAPRNSLELVDEPKKIARALSSHDLRRQEHIITADGSSKKETLGGFSEAGHSAKRNAPFASTITSSQSPSTETTDQNLLSLRNSPRDTCDADAGGITGPATRTLPGLLDEIMSKGKRMTYEELCNAVLPHWNNLRKHNGERYAYSSHSQAVLDCLRNRNEWAQLVDRGPKTNAGRKKRKPESEPPVVEQEENDHENEYGKMRTTKELSGKKFEAHPEDFPRGKRNARKRRRLALQGRGIRDVRKRQKSNVITDDELGQFSNSSDNDVIFSEDSQGAATLAIGSEASSSFDEAGSL